MKAKVVLSIILLSSVSVKAAYPVGSKEGLACNWSAVLDLAGRRAVEVMLNDQKDFSITRQGLEAHVKIDSEIIILRGRDDLQKFTRVGKAELEHKIKNVEKNRSLVQQQRVALDNPDSPLFADEKARMTPAQFSQHVAQQKERFNKILVFAQGKINILNTRLAHLTGLEQSIRS